MWVKSPHRFWWIWSCFCLWPYNLHHFFLGRMYLRIVSAKQHTCCWAFVLSEILIKDLGEKHTSSYVHLPRWDGHVHWPDCQSLQDGRLRGREGLRTSGEVDLQGRSCRGKRKRWDDKLLMDCDKILKTIRFWYNYENDRSWMGVGYWTLLCRRDALFCPAFVQEILPQFRTVLVRKWNRFPSFYKKKRQTTNIIFRTMSRHFQNFKFLGFQVKFQKCFWWRRADWNFNCTWLKGQWKQRSSWRKHTGSGIAGHFACEAVVQWFLSCEIWNSKNSMRKRGWKQKTRGGYLSSRWGMVDWVAKLDLQLFLKSPLPFLVFSYAFSPSKPTKPTQKL